MTTIRTGGLVGLTLALLLVPLAIGLGDPREHVQLTGTVEYLDNASYCPEATVLVTVDGVADVWIASVQFPSIADCPVATLDSVFFQAFTPYVFPLQGDWESGFEASFSGGPFHGVWIGPYGEEGVDVPFAFCAICALDAFAGAWGVLDDAKLV